MNGIITIAGVAIEPGERRDLAPAASESFTGDLTSLPMTVFNGVEDGPRLFVTAAVHGDELNGIAVCRRLLEGLDTSAIAGSLIVVPIANVPAAQIASRYMPDRRDLNRSFPGSHSGSMAARFARLLIDEVVVGSDVGVDIHTAANHRTNSPQVRIRTDDEIARGLALTFGAPFILDAKLRPGSLRAAAGDRGVTVLTYEGGGPLRWDEDAIDVAHRGVLRVLQRLGMIDEAPGPAAREPMILHESRWLRAEHGGILAVHVESGSHVRPGDPLWTTTSPLGVERAQVDAEEEGFVIGSTTLPLVQPGHAILHIALPGDREPSEDDVTEEEDLDPDDLDIS